MDEKRERAIQGIAQLLRVSAFDVEIRVKKKPKGVKIVVELTQEQLDHSLRNLYFL